MTRSIIFLLLVGCLLACDKKTIVTECNLNWGLDSVTNKPAVCQKCFQVEVRNNGSEIPVRESYDSAKCVFRQ